jgi:hypothetical protein
MNSTERLSEFEGRADRAIYAWDSHVSACPRCLVFGNELCTDGVYLSSDVITARAVVESFETRLLSRELGGRGIPASSTEGVGA